MRDDDQPQPATFQQTSGGFGAIHGRVAQIKEPDWREVFNTRYPLDKKFELQGKDELTPEFVAQAIAAAHTQYIAVKS